MAAVSPEDVAVCAMNEAELRYGALNSGHSDKHTSDVEASLGPSAERHETRGEHHDASLANLTHGRRRRLARLRSFRCQLG